MFFPSATIEWSILDHKIRKLSVFKQNILKFIRPTPNTVFKRENHKDSKFLQDCASLSHLFEHKFRHKLMYPEY